MVSLAIRLILFLVERWIGKEIAVLKDSAGKLTVVEAKSDPKSKEPFGVTWTADRPYDPALDSGA